MSKQAQNTKGGIRATRLFRASMLVVSAATIAMTAACSNDGPLAPTPAPEQPKASLTDLYNTLKAALDSVKGLERITPLAAPITASKTFDSDGGTLVVPGTGFTLIVPAKAIPGKSLKITVTALAGRTVAYDFEPHGTNFKAPLTFSQSLSGTNWLVAMLAGKLLGGAYFKSTAQVNTKTNKAVVDEVFTAQILNGTLQFGIPHFSGYMVSTGRAEASVDEM